MSFTVHTPLGEFTCHRKRKVCHVTIYRLTKRILYRGAWREPGFLMPVWHYKPLAWVSAPATLYGAARLRTFDMAGKELVRVDPPSICCPNCGHTFQHSGGHASHRHKPGCECPDKRVAGCPEVEDPL